MAVTIRRPRSRTPPQCSSCTYDARVAYRKDFSRPPSPPRPCSSRPRKRRWRSSPISSSTVTAAPDPVAAGGVVGYSITVLNDGPGSTAPGVLVAVPVPSGASYSGSSGTGVAAAG